MTSLMHDAGYGHDALDTLADGMHLVELPGPGMLRSNAGGQQGTAMGSCVRSMSTVPCLWQAPGPHLGVGHACTRWRTWTSGRTLPYLNQGQLDVHRVPAAHPGGDQ